MIDIKLNPSKRIYFCSDNHLGSPNRNLSLEREKIFITWLDQIKTDAQAIFFLGDLFDFWFEYKKVVPKGFTRLFGKLAELSDSGIDLFFFVGNHDCWIGNYFEDELGINVFHKKVDLNIDNYNILIGHGDGLGPGDRFYKFIKTFFQSKVCQWFFARLHPNLGMGIANFWSKKSRISNIKKGEEFLGDEKEWLYIYAQNILKKEHFDYFIFGHRHLVLDLKIKNKNARYINLGEWVTGNPHFAWFDGDELTLQPVQQ